MQLEFNWMDQPSSRKPRGYWNEDSIREEAKKYKSKIDFQRRCGHVYQLAIKLGIIDELFENQLRYWTEESAREEAKKYKSKIDFQRRCASAYQVAIKLGIIDSLFENQPRYTQANVIYCWLVDGVLISDKQLIKVGITSKRLGNLRVKQCSSVNGFKIKHLEMFDCDTSKEVESKVLTYLKHKPTIDINDGKKEFRLIERGTYFDVVEMIRMSIRENP